MKTIVYAIFVLLIYFVFVSCTNEGDNEQRFYVPLNYEYNEESNTSQCIADENELVLLCYPHFRVIYISSLPDSRYYRYEIFNNNGELVKYRTIWRVQPCVSYINENVIKILTSPGTNIRQVLFYSITNNVFSDIFESPFILYDEIIAYIEKHDNEHKLVLRNIFNAEIYYNEISLEEFYLSGNPFFSILEIEYLGFGRIEITFLTGEDFNLTSKILDI